MRVLDYPKRIVIELASMCNLSCGMCPRNYINEKEGSMVRVLWERIIDEIFECSPKSIILPFWRGEALLHHDFIELITYALRKKLSIHIATNGVLAKGEHAEILLECEFVSFSVHDESGYRQARDFMASRTGNRPTVQLSFVEGEGTANILLEPLLTSQDLGGFDSIRIYKKHSKGGLFGKSEGIVESLRTFCPKLEDSLVIAYDGSISRCNHIWNTEKRLNAGLMTIDQIWHSLYFEKVRSDYPDHECSGCDQWLGHTCGESYQIVGEKIEHRIFHAERVA